MQPLPTRGKRARSSPSCLLAARGVPAEVPKVQGAWERAELRGRSGQSWAGLRVAGGGSGSRSPGSRRSARPGLSSNHMVPPGSAPGAFKEVAPGFAPGTGQHRRGAGGRAGRTPSPSAGYPALQPSAPT